MLIFGALYSDWAIAIVLNNNIKYPYNAKTWVSVIWTFYMIGKRLNFCPPRDVRVLFYLSFFLPWFLSTVWQGTEKDLYQANCFSVGVSFYVRPCALVYLDYTSRYISYDQATNLSH